MKKIHQFLLGTRLRQLLTCMLFLSLLYGSGRLYFHLTDGFVESNIYHVTSYDTRWETTPFTNNDKSKIQTILSQPFHYLGKGCQSYVFASDDGQYVIKFLKYQRFRPKAWLDYFAFLPFFDGYRNRKIESKQLKLDNVFAGWKLAYEELPEETGVVYVHLNKTKEIDQELIVYDKMGLQHTINLADTEFLLQKKASMLCSVLLKHKISGNLANAKAIIDNLFALLISEYSRGYADNDHALMQNTGVLFDIQPVHIDVGQFIRNPIVTDLSVRNQELFNKTWKFRRWLRENYPVLADYTDEQLALIIGESFSTMQPKLYTSDVGRIPHIP